MDAFAWTRIGRKQPPKLDVTKEPEKPWIKQKKLIESFEARNIKKCEDKDIDADRRLSEWTRVGPEKSEALEKPQSRPERPAKKKKVLTTDQRLENPDPGEKMPELFDDERFNDISRRINKHNKWKRLKNIGRIKKNEKR